MKVTIEIKNRVSGRFNTPCKVKEAMTEQRITVAQYLNDLFTEKKIDGTVYLKLKKQISRLTKKNDAEGISRILTLNEISQVAFSINYKKKKLMTIKTDKK